MNEIILAQTDEAEKVVGQRVIIEESSSVEQKPEEVSVSGGSNFLYALGAIGLLVLGLWAVKQFLAKPPSKPISVTPQPKKK